MSSLLPHYKYTGTTTNYKLTHLRNEINNWKRQMSFMMDENIYLKNRLSEILKDNFREQLLEEIDSFQSRFIKEDERISLLRNSLAEIDKRLDLELPGEKNPFRQVEKQLKIFRDNITISENEFSKLKIMFNNFMRENIS